MASAKDIENLLRLNLGEVPPDIPLATIVEMARKEVEGGLGKWTWRKLLKLDTITVSTNVSDYTIPSDSVGDAPIERLIAIKEPGLNKVPIPILNTDEYLNTEIQSENQFITIIGYPNVGFMDIRIQEPPGTNGTLEVWYSTKSKDGDLDFIPRTDHGVFYWAAMQYAMNTLKMPNVGGMGLSDVVSIYMAKMEIAIKNDFY